MYNRYLTASSGGGVHGYAPNSAPPIHEQTQQTAEKTASTGIFGGILDSFSAPKLDSDLLIAVAVIWFLLSDGEASNTDLLIILAVLLVLGL